MINFFSLNQKLILADLPGYGFNVANREIRKLWDSLVRHYVIRPNIRYFFFLMDGRRQLEDFEYDFIIDLQEKTSVVIVLTKTDKMKTREIALKEAEIKKDLASRRIPVEGVFSISSLNKKGIDRLQKLILDLMVAEVKKDPLAEKTQ
jgi:GTP-binding protein